MSKRKMWWLSYADDLHIELMQGRDEGRDGIDAFEEKVKTIQLMDSEDEEREMLAARVFDEMAKLPIRSGFSYFEPSELEEIKKERVEPVNKLLPGNVSRIQEDKLYDRVYGAWLGRCAGCLLGQPIEGWARERIVGLLKDTGNYPVNRYISSDLPEEMRSKYKIADIDVNKPYGREFTSWINNVKHAPADDDTNYMTVAMKVVEENGLDFTPYDVAETWLRGLPILHTCTAERVAYKNIVNGIAPPFSASWRNPYREWIGAQIRGDFFGYITPGDPELGAELAWRDASVSHVKNGIYGEMAVAAMLSAAFAEDDIEAVIRAGISQIPARSRLYEAILNVLDWKKENITWEDAIDRIHCRYNQANPHDWCHTVSNAMIVCISLLFGEKDFEKSIGVAVSAGFDTDCNGATVGSILGLMLGARALPPKWINPLNDRLKSTVDGFGLVRISDMAKRTVDIIAQ